MKVESRRSLERAVLEQQRAQRVAVDRDVAQRLRDDRGQEDGLAGEEVHLAQEARRAVADDLAAGGVQDRDLALEDRDERVAAVADPEEHVADRRRALLAERGERRELRGGEERARGRRHGLRLAGGLQAGLHISSCAPAVFRSITRRVPTTRGFRLMRVLVFLSVTTAALLAATTASASKPPTTGPGCKPMSTVVLKGTVAAAPGASPALPFGLEVKVGSSNSAGAAYVTATQPVTVTVTASTTIDRKGSTALSSLLAGDGVTVKAPACKADLAGGATPALTAASVSAKPVKTKKS